MAQTLETTRPIEIESLRFLTATDVRSIAKRWGTPVFVYDEAILLQQADAALAFPAPYGLEVRYAMKANPHRYVIDLLTKRGISIDASSGFEAERALLAGVDPKKILITTQELPKDLTALIKQGVEFNACSLHQLEEYGKLLPGTNVGVRINPGIGSGSTKRTNVGGNTSSFGIWHEYTDEILRIARTYELTITRVHTHIGSGADPVIWTEVANLSLEQVKSFPDVTTLDLGGGFKVGRMKDEYNTDLRLIGESIANSFINFYNETGRKLKLEIEPGTFLVANAGSLLTTAQDIVNTGKDGYTFLKLDAGMTEILRPSFYGIRHPIVVVNDEKDYQKYVVVGHCCESGDLLTPSVDTPENAEAISERLLHKANIGDIVVIEGVGAYCASVSAHNYNSFPIAAIVARAADGSFVELSRRETLKESTRLEAIKGE